MKTIKKMESLKIREGIAKCFNFVKTRKWVILSFLVALSILDYYDFGLAVGWGVFSKQFKPNPVEAIVAIFLLFTLFETWKATKESLRQTELTLRSYMRLNWDSTQIGDNRRAQGITDTCIVVSNNGKGLMRLVKYNVEVDGKKVGVRNHSIIVSGTSINMVYDDADNDAGAALGCRNDGAFSEKNNEIIKQSKIKVYGSYRDIEGGKYAFSFESDVNEQSWFKERYRQQLTN